MVKIGGDGNSENIESKTAEGSFNWNVLEKKSAIDVSIHIALMSKWENSLLLVEGKSKVTCRKSSAALGSDRGLTYFKLLL